MGKNEIRYRQPPIATRAYHYMLQGGIYDADVEVCRYALIHGVDMAYYVRPGYWTPLHLLCDLWRAREKDAEVGMIAQMLLDAGAEINALSGSVPPVYLAAANGNVALVNFLIDRGADVNLRESDDQPDKILAWPLARGYLSIVSLLLEHGAETDNIDGSGCDAHLWAELHLKGDTLGDALKMIDEENIRRNRIVHPQLFEER